MRRLLLIALFLPGLALGQNAVKLYATDTVQSACVLNALNTTCQIAMAGKSTAGFLVTAISSPAGITLVNESSRDGTSWDGHNFVDMDNGGTLATVPNASLAVGYTKTMVLGGGVRFARVRASAWTSGSVTVSVVGSDTSMVLPVTQEVSDGTAQPTAGAAGTWRAPIGTPDGAAWVRTGGPVRFQCSLNAIAATLTQCQAAPAAGLSIYVTDIFAQSTTTTAGTFALNGGTGTNCGTGGYAVLPASATANRYGYPASSAAATVLTFGTPIKLTAATALCAIGVATNTLRIDILGYIAP
jgi:hypothetical protein